MPINQKDSAYRQAGIAHIALIILAVLGIVLGLYLVQTKTNLFPHAQQDSTTPQTAFYLSLSRDNKMMPIPQPADNDTQDSTAGAQQTSENANRGWYKPGDQVAVNLAVSSDIDYSNVFNANIQFPADLLEVSSIQVNGNNYDNKNVPDYSQPGAAGGMTAPAGPRELPSYNGSMPSDTAVTEPSSGGPVVSNTRPPGQNCAQVVTWACHFVQTAPGCKPQPDGRGSCELIGNNECKEFPTPCDVPDGWFIEGPNKPSAPPVVTSGCTSDSECQSGQTCQQVCTMSYPATCRGVCGSIGQAPSPVGTPGGIGGGCRPRPACLDNPDILCKMAEVETDDMCPPSPDKVRNYFIKFWIDQKFDNTAGTISLIGGMPAQGIKTSPPNRPLMATIIFKAKKAGSAELKFNDESAIIRVTDNTNILTGKNGLTVDIKEQPVVIGDIDGDGKVSYKDFSILLSRWGTNDPKADLNGDGKVNIFDFSLLLSNWRR